MNQEIYEWRFDIFFSLFELLAKSRSRNIHNAVKLFICGKLNFPIWRVHQSFKKNLICENLQ